MDLSNDSLYKKFLNVLSNKALLLHEEWQYERRCDESKQADAIKRIGIIQAFKHDRGLDGQRS